MRPATRLLLTPLLLLLLVATAAAEDFSTTAVFAFAPAPGPDVVKDPNKELRATENLAVRPNGAAEFYLYAHNPAKVQKTYLVDLKGAPGTGLSARTKVTIPAGQWVRVRLPKPAPPAPPPPVAVVPAPAAPAAEKQPAPAPPPPGSELAASKGQFLFTLRLLADDGTPVKDAAGDPYGREVAVTVVSPEAYIAPPVGTITQIDTLTRVAVTVSPKLNEAKQPVFVGAADLKLSFPPQLALTKAVVREGFYRRSLPAEAGAKAKLVGMVEGAGTEVRAHVAVDGVERAFIYKPAPAASTDAGKLIRDPLQAVWVYPAAGYAPAAATQPVTSFPVRVEADNPPPDATLELWVRPAGSTDDPTVNEVVRLGGPREERAWLDPAGPVDQGVLITNRSRDWVRGLDVFALRGKQEIVAVMTTRGPTGPVRVKSPPLLLTIDATPPDRVTIGKLAAKHVKGKPLPVRASAADPETRVVKATFFLGKPLDDGKLPPDAILAEGKPLGVIPNVWTADLPLPADKRGEGYVGVIFVNEVGLATMRTQRIELVDAPPPFGAIDGVVMVGDRPQPGLVVSLRDGEGKEKMVGKTDDTGKFKFEKVIPGTYTVASAKPTSSYPFAGVAPVQVEADKRAKVAVPMSKQVR
jgi:hypothetical protein